MKLAIIGVSGMVGASLLKVLEEFNFKFDDFIPVASEKSLGKSVYLFGKEYKIISIEQALEQKPDIAIFSAGKSVSLKWAEKFANNSCFVVDNSSAWRMNENIPLIIPEVNISILEKENKIIANPNCSTIQLATVLWPLHLRYKLKRVIISTYQSVTGSGHKGINQLIAERSGQKPEQMAYPHQIDLNCIPQGGEFLENNYTEEEMKLVYETRKILGLDNLKITATVVRVPVFGGHSESVNIELENKFEISEIKDTIEETNGLSLLDNPQKNIYPMPLIAENSNHIFVGRVRRDESCENTVNLWIVADNLRKGAATNAVQIAQYICDNFIE
ncbi:MAG: aspartate-semialdehyde dehydrogenase [Bacteroidales bacterium]|nr:aspartate-semialdehyde dehydrogenase [Bacteroidales bacterium]